MVITLLVFGGGLAYWYGLITHQRVALIAGATGLVIALGLLLEYGGVEPPAIPLLAFMTLLGFALKRVQRGCWRYLGWIAFIGVVLALGFQVIPFFEPVATAAHGDRFPPEKVVLMLLLPPMVLAPWSSGQSAPPVRRPWLASLLILAAIMVLVIPIALITGFVKPGLADQSADWLAYWLAYNLLYTCVLEESFFRGMAQTALVQGFKQRLAPAHARLAGIAAASILFGLAHFGGGATYVILATIAGVGYGLAYDLTGRLHHAVLVHFSVNAIRLLVFSGA